MGRMLSESLECPERLDRVLAATQAWCFGGCEGELRAQIFSTAAGYFTFHQIL